MRLRWWLMVAGLAGMIVVATANAQSPGTLRGSWLSGLLPLEPNPAYDGRYAFTRLRYDTDKTANKCSTGEGPGWRHDYPVADRNLMRMITALTRIDVRSDSSLVVAADDPELMKYPIVYLSEPGCWVPLEPEVEGLRAYLQKGGLLIVDDVTSADWKNFEIQIQRVLPEGRLVQLDRSNIMFRLVFRADAETGGLNQDGQFYGVFKNNDPTKRLMVIATDNNDLGDHWQWSGPGQQTNDAYRLGLNYILYGFTH